MPTTRANRQTVTRAMDVVYSDFDISFKKNPVTGNLLRITNEEAVKQSLKNIIMTMRGEWPYHSTLGSKVYWLLFEPLDQTTGLTISDVIRTALVNEPRISLIGLSATPDYDRDGYAITITYQTINSTEPTVFSDFLERVR